MIIRFITYMDIEDLEDRKVNLPTTNVGRSGLSVHLLRSVPEEEIWLAGQLSAHTRRAYKQDVAHFIATMKIKSGDELRLVSRAAVVAWQNEMEKERAKARTIRRRLSALSSLFAHLIAHRAADENPVRDIKRPRVNRRQGTTKAFSQKEARLILDVPKVTTLRGLRDRAILSVGFQAGPRRSEIASLLVKDFHTNAGYKSLHFIRKGGQDLSLALNPQTAQRIHEYLAAAGLLRKTPWQSRQDPGCRRITRLDPRLITQKKVASDRTIEVYEASKCWLVLNAGIAHIKWLGLKRQMTV